MHALILILAAIIQLVALGCTVYIWIDAFRDAIWKGLACIFCCGLYFLYYALFEFEDDNKWLIVIGALGGSSIAAGLARTFY